MAIDVVMTPKTASGIEIESNTKGAIAYIGFHMLSSTLEEPSRNNIVSARGV